MKQWIIPVIFLLIVMLLMMGQWLMKRRAKSIERRPVPSSLKAICSRSDLLAFLEAPGCGACRSMVPMLEPYSEARPDQVCRVDIREHPQLASDLRIMGTPTWILIRDGYIKEVRLGAISSAKLDAMMSELPE